MPLRHRPAHAGARALRRSLARGAGACRHGSVRAGAHARAWSGSTVHGALDSEHPTEPPSGAVRDARRASPAWVLPRFVPTALRAGVSARVRAPVRAGLCRNCMWESPVLPAATKFGSGTCHGSAANGLRACPHGAPRSGACRAAGRSPARESVAPAARNTRAQRACVAAARLAPRVNRAPAAGGTRAKRACPAAARQRRALNGGDVLESPNRTLSPLEVPETHKCRCASDQPMRERARSGEAWRVLRERAARGACARALTPARGQGARCTMHGALDSEQPTEPPYGAVRGAPAPTAACLHTTRQASPERARSLASGSLPQRACARLRQFQRGRRSIRGLEHVSTV